MEQLRQLVVWLTESTLVFVFAVGVLAGIIGALAVVFAVR